MIKKVILSAFLAFLCFHSRGQAPQVGVMVLAHGGGDSWNQLVMDATRGIADKYPTEVAFGMALPRTMQEAVDKLEGMGVEKIVVVPLFISSHSFIIRQSEYLLGVREKLADPPMVMDHSMDPGKAPGSAPMESGHMNDSPGSHGQMGHDMHKQTATLERLRTKSKIIFCKPLDDHPLVAQIIYQRIGALSKNPSREMVILVGHGPNPEDDNRKWVADMESIADQVRVIQKKNKQESKMMLAVTVRDDADPTVYNQAKENLRNLVSQGGRQGDVIVVPVFLSEGGAEQKIVTRLEGLSYTWNGKTLLPDPRISEFISQSVRGALSK
ncbi:MAG: CbiX/SirB N-terminal domain-containing protein [Cytophagales bacterium]|nr:CbiX/SirB N-terminal domain-containing protein [Cytophagales bacterium]